MENPNDKIDAEEIEREADYRRDLAERQVIENFHAELERRDAEGFADEEARMAAKYELWLGCYGEV
jgi:hypothetical protein